MRFLNHPYVFTTRREKDLEFRCNTLDVSQVWDLPEILTTLCLVEIATPIRRVYLGFAEEKCIWKKFRTYSAFTGGWFHGDEFHGIESVQKSP